jgi:hypothetical protein
VNDLDLGLDHLLGGGEIGEHGFRLYDLRLARLDHDPRLGGVVRLEQ